ncbi:MAG: Gfo/Idh/MocA family oxidoreductase [Chloroflexi bacterium]|nr:Gfo/Idh/MocA family oxidoreductase [Chloroflexota bacterium]MCC6895055.1 Gfo/Idh/MocA family oxidoreductase [Anaerolineae bacterium]
MRSLALIGCAHIHTPNFIERIKKRDGLHVKYVWDHDTERAGRSAGKLGSQVTSDLTTIWNDDDVKAVIICSETNRHEPLVLGAAAAKKHIFAEKPLGIGTADSYKMAKAIEDAGVIFQTGYFQRGNPINQFVREHIQKGSFGKITRIRHTNCHSGSLGGWFDTDWRWMADPSQAGVGAYGDLGTHSLDILIWLMGSVERVTATLKVVTGRYGDCDESGEGLLQFSNGTIGTLAAGWVDVADPVWLQISGTEGLAYAVGDQLYFRSQHVEGADGKSPWTDLPAPQPAGFDLFLDKIESKSDAPLVSVQEAAYRSAVMEALYKGAEQQTWVAPSAAE